MRTFIIAVLSVALLAAAFFTRPGKRELMLYLLDKQSGGGVWTQSAISHAEGVAKMATVKNRFLWTDVEKDGKVVYTGAFAHWFARGEEGEKPLPRVTELARVMGQ